VLHCGSVADRVMGESGVSLANAEIVAFEEVDDITDGVASAGSARHDKNSRAIRGNLTCNIQIRSA